MFDGQDDGDDPEVTVDTTVIVTTNDEEAVEEFARADEVPDDSVPAEGDGS